MAGPQPLGANIECCLSCSDELDLYEDIGEVSEEAIALASNELVQYTVGVSSGGVRRLV